MADLDVFIDGTYAGEIRSDARGNASFRYDGHYTRTQFGTALSVRVPLDNSAHDVSAWLDGLLPDNREVRRRWATRHNAASVRPVDLLATPIGLDCAGAVQFRISGSSNEIGQRSSGIDWLNEAGIADWIRRARIDWGRWHGISAHGEFSLGGAQAKCAVYREGDKWGSPYGDTPTTHILKPGLQDKNAGEIVEHICLQAANHLGIESANSEIFHFDDERVIAVERFDREERQGRLWRLHQEDLCQAMSIHPDQKYQSEGGPGPSDVFGLLKAEATDWRSDTSRFIDALIYHWAIAAPDAHAKNYSISLNRGLVRMTPLYDVISILPYAEGTPHWKLKTAMKIGSDYTLRKSSRRGAWGRLAESVGIDPVATVDRAEQIMRSAPDAIAAVIDGLDVEDRAPHEVYELDRLMKRRAGDVLRGFASRQPSNPKASSKPEPSREPQRRQRAVLCGGGDAGDCRRRLLTKPCPSHPNSQGSQTVLASRRIFDQSARQAAIDASQKQAVQDQ